MQNEIDSSNIIAVFAKYKESVDKLELPYCRIREVAERLEMANPTLLATYDLVSIDAFRCSFTHYVVMEENRLVINNLEEIKWRLQKLLPSREITDMIVSISNEYNR